jgi:hypothetical protein
MVPARYDSLLFLKAACGRPSSAGRHHPMRPPRHLHGYFFTVTVMQSLIST